MHVHVGAKTHIKLNEKMFYLQLGIKGTEKIPYMNYWFNQSFVLGSVVSTEIV